MSAAVFATAAVLLWASAVAYIDWRQRRVPNALLAGLLLVALAALLIGQAGLLGAGWSSSLIGMAVAFALTLPGYGVSRLGAGDVKLAAVMGFVLGWPLTVNALLIAALLLGAMALGAVLVLGLAAARTLRIPAAVALSGGFAAVVLWQQGGWL